MTRVGRRTRAESLRSMIGRVDATLDCKEPGFPHFADPATGVWIRTNNGDWSGGFWPGLLWLAAVATGEDRYHSAAASWTERLRPRARTESAYRGFVFWYGAALGALLLGHQGARAVALEGALALARLYNPAARLIPLGSEAEEVSDVGRDQANLGAVPGGTALLIWAAREIGEGSLEGLGVSHAARHAEMCVRHDGSVCQSASFDVKSGQVLRRYTHKGINSESTWSRAQAWAILGFTQAARWRPEFRDVAVRVADWWVGHLPADDVAYWDFDDPDAPHTQRDTSATAIAAAALLKLARLAPEHADAYRKCAERMVEALRCRYLTPVTVDDVRPHGILTGGCYHRRTGLATNHELIWGDYFLFESLCALEGHLDATLV